mgnify:CR=1 FL=1
METVLLDFITALPERILMGIRYESTRYVIGTIGVFVVIWLMIGPFIRARRIRKRLPSKLLNKQVRMELLNSFRTILVFVALDIVIFDLAENGVFQFYNDPAEFGAIYYWASILLGIIFHDTYFYWTHRAMHHAKLYKRFHLTHHRSYNPTPFTAYSFAVGEAVVEYGYVPLMLLVLPLHPSALAIILLIMIFKNALGHCGYEIFPRGATRHWFWKHMTTVTHHDMHHEKAGGNFGLYFTWWDKIMGTEHSNYHERFDAVTGKSRPLAISA